MCKFSLLIIKTIVLILPLLANGQVIFGNENPKPKNENQTVNIGDLLDIPKEEIIIGSRLK